MPDIKIIISLVGDYGVGKTCLAERWIENTWKSKTKSTVGIDFRSQYLNLDFEGREETINFQIWDCQGQDKYNSLPKLYFRGVDQVVFIYDITFDESFQKVVKWIDKIQNEKDVFISSYKPVAIIGCKKDLTQLREVSWSELKRVGEKYNLLYQELSSLTGENMEIIKNIIIQESWKKKIARARIQRLEIEMSQEIHSSIYKNSCCSIS